MPLALSARLVRTVRYIIGALFFGIMLNACSDAPPAPKAPELSIQTLSPTQALSIGHKSAVYQHLSRQWRLEHINNMPIKHEVYLDLSHLDHQHAILRLPEPCPAIDIYFDTDNLPKGELSVIEIVRQLSNCSTDEEDRLMAILADTRGIERDPNQPNKITLRSYQDTLDFSTTDPLP